MHINCTLYKRNRMTEKKTRKTKTKKGRTSWKPAQLLTVRNKTPGFRYRWVTNDVDNLRKKGEEGWIKVGSTMGLKGDHERPDNTIDGGPMCSDATEYRESILMALPEELGIARDEYHENKVREQSHQKMRGELESGMSDIGSPGHSPKLHGGITFD